MRILKKYMGTSITAMAGIVMPIFCVGPLVFSIFLLELIAYDKMAICLIILNLSGTIICTFYLIKIWDQLYSWGLFKKNCVEIKPLFKKKIIIEYAKCSDIGVGCYTHGVLNLGFGSKVRYIYLSHSRVSKENKYNLNLLPPTISFAKTSYNTQLYTFLLSVLPSKQVLILKESYYDMKSDFKTNRK